MIPEDLTDNALADMRTERKRVENPGARIVEKAGHQERNFDLVSEEDPLRRYRIFVRQSRFEPTAFSAGLIREFSAGTTLVLVRYNGPTHTHRNRLEGTRLPACTHRHVTKASYLERGMAADGFAVRDTRFTTVEGALRCLLEDCNVSGLTLPPDSLELGF